MITKREFAEYIIDKYKCKERKTEVNDSDAYRSSGVGVAMEFLGLLTDKKIKEYVSYRGGTFLVDIYRLSKEPVIISVRDMLQILPDKID